MKLLEVEGDVRQCPIAATIKLSQGYTAATLKQETHHKMR